MTFAMSLLSRNRIASKPRFRRMPGALINQSAKRRDLQIALFHRRDSLVLAERIQPHREIPRRRARPIQTEIDCRVVGARIDSFQKAYPGRYLADLILHGLD